MNDTHLVPCLNAIEQEPENPPTPLDWHQVNVADYASAAELLEMLEAAGYHERWVIRSGKEYHVRWHMRSCSPHPN